MLLKEFSSIMHKMLTVKLVIAVGGINYGAGVDAKGERMQKEQS